MLVYRYLKHPIDLYVFPANGNAGEARIGSKDGYALARWTEGGMAYWAITDAEPAHLQAFEQAVRAANR